MSQTTLRLRLGLRREVLILLPVALFLLVLISTFTLFAFRQAISLLAEERREEAARIAQRLAETVSEGALPSLDALLLQAPQSTRIALVDTSGLPVLEVGSFPSGDLLAPLADREPTEPLGLGPGEPEPDFVVGIAPATWQGRRHFVRVDLAARRLAGQQRGLRVLSWVVLTIDVALTVLVLLFLRHLLTPYETMLERARQLGRRGDESEDEATFLVSTFERALEALAQPPERGGEDDIAALERTLGPSLESGLLLLDRQGRVLALNRIGAQLLDIEQPPPGTALAEALAVHPSVRDVIGQAVADGRTVQRQELEIEIAQAVRTLGLTVHPLRRDDGSIRGSFVLFADLTETRRRAEEEKLAASLVQVGELAAGVAHEMRNSLATLRGYLTLVERAPDEGSITDFMSEIRRESDHLQRVLEDFLSFARPGTTRMEEIDLEIVVRRAAADPALGGFEVRVERAEGAVTEIKGDAQLLERAVRNLLHNAAEAERGIDRAGPLTARLESSPDGLELAIQDRGPGIPAEIRERLFQPFASAGGVGLGLALSRRIVDLHGGRLTLEDRPGGGTRARILFPVGGIATKGNEASPAEPRQPPSASARTR